MSLPKPIIEENTVEVDPTLDHFLNHEAEQHTSSVENGLGFIDPADVFVPILVVETNEPLIDHSI